MSHTNGGSVKQEEVQISGEDAVPLPPWPFFLVDGVLVGAAAMLMLFSAPEARPVGVATLLLVLGAVVFLIPYFLQWYARVREAEVRREASIQEQESTRGELILRLEQVIDRITSATDARDFQSGSHDESGEEGGIRLDGSSRADLSETVERLEALMREWSRSEEQLVRAVESVKVDLAALREEVGGKLSRPVPTSEPAPSFPAEEDSEGPDVDAVEEASSDEGATEATSASPVKKNKTVKSSSRAAKPIRKEMGDGLFSTTTLLATAFMEEESQLFLRGEGPGLSWEKGVPMQFLEVGRWGWTTSEAVSPVTVRLYKDDQDEDPAGDYILEPGSSLEVWPDL